MRNIAIIVAGGSGTRFGGSVPKQFVLLKGRPVLMHTLERFHRFFTSVQTENGELVLVLPAAHFATWQSLCMQHDFRVPHRLVAGGSTRYHSVLNALSCIEREETGDVVAIHDGVRPLVSLDVIKTAFMTARQAGSAVPSIPVTDSVRMLEHGGASHALDRSLLRAVQTPQTFDLQELKKAYQQPYQECFTDDASVYERLGMPVTLIDGNVGNIKITNAGDLKLAEILLGDE